MSVCEGRSFRSLVAFRNRGTLTSTDGHLVGREGQPLDSPSSVGNPPQIQPDIPHQPVGVPVDPALVDDLLQAVSISSPIASWKQAVYASSAKKRGAGFSRLDVTIDR